MADNWGEIIPTDIAAKIAEHVELYDDYEAFPEVCSTWRLAIEEAPHEYTDKKHTQLPLLMLVDPYYSPYRRLYSLTKRNFLKVDLPSSVVGDKPTRYFSSRGWFISVSPTSTETSLSTTYRITLFNPLSNNVIEPPEVHFDAYGQWIESPGVLIDPLGELEPSEWDDLDLLASFDKFALSTTPLSMAKASGSKGNDDDFVVAMTFGHRRQLAFWRPSQDRWVVPHSSGLNTGWFYDLCSFRGEFYAISNAGNLIAFGDSENHERPPRVVACVEDLIDPIYEGNLYLVESRVDDQDQASCLLVVQRILSVKYKTKTKYWTKSFKVFKVNVDNGETEQLNSLGNQAIFVGYNSTFCVKASAIVDDDNDNDNERGCKADCIYYTDDAFETYPSCKRGGGGRDMGIYSLELRKTIHYQPSFYEGPSHSRFSLINPPTWVEFPSTSIT